MFSRRQAQRYLDAALNLADTNNDGRRYRLAAIGIRNDGVTVYSRNGSAVTRTPRIHAEARLAQKLTPGSVVFVARSRRDRKKPGTARPCENCMSRLRAAGVVRVYFTTEEGFDHVDF